MDRPRIYKREEMLSVAKVAERLGCSRQHVYNLIDLGESEGGLPAFRFGNLRGWRIPEPALDNLINCSRIDPAA